MRRRPLSRSILIGLAVVLAVLAVPAVAAHADLVEAEPAANSRVDQAPEELRLLFSERLSTTYTDVRVVLDDVDRAQRVVVDEGDARRLVVELDRLPDGVHSVHWRTLSEVDGHTRSGAYFLAVNVSLQDTPGPGAPPGFESDESDGGALEAVARAVAFAGMALAAGLVLCWSLVGAAGLRVQAHLMALSAAGAGAGAVGVLATLVLLGSRIDAPLAETMQTGPGQVLMLRAALAGSAAVAYLAAYLWRRLRMPALALGGVLSLAALIATSLGGHAAAESGHLALAIVNDWVHLAAVSFWVSGVVLLLLATRSGSDTSLAAYIRVFSPLALLAVLLIVITGVLASVDRLPHVASLWSTGYGWALAMKILLMAPLVALGTYHRYKILPRLERDGGGRRLRLSATIEVGVMALVLAAAGALTNTSPPSPEQGAVDDEVGTPYHAFEEAGLEVEVFITPLPVQVGFQEVFVDVIPTEGSDVNRSQLSSFLSLHEPGAAGGEATPVEAHVFHNGTFHWGGALFTVPGNWSATLVLQGGQGDAFVYVQHEFQVSVRPAGG